MKLGVLAQHLGAELSGPGDLEIAGVAGIREAQAGQVTYIGHDRSPKECEETGASAVIAPLAFGTSAKPLLRVKNPRLAFARAIALLHVRPRAATGVSPLASIAATAIIGNNVSIYPFVTVDNHAIVADGVVLYPGVSIGAASRIGEGAVIHANVSIGDRVTIGSRVIIHAGTVIGSDGFGFVTDSGIHHKIPQVGGVVIEDDVEIGGNCTIDRATLGNTVIKKGTKLDNQVHVAHNVTIGEHCLIAGQVGIAGSTNIGRHVVFGGQVGVKDHTTVGDGVMAGGKAVIAQDVPSGQVVAGFYAMPVRDWLKVQAMLPKLPELKRRIADLERRISDQEQSKPTGEERGRT